MHCLPTPVAPGEKLRDWPVAGTVGYEFLNDVQGLFVDPAGEATLTSLLHELTGEARSFDEVALEAQLEQVFRNLTAVLEASGSSIDHVVKATVFLADMNDYNKMNELYRKQFKGDPPARSTVQVARLPRDARIEIEVVSVVK